MDDAVFEGLADVVRFPGGQAECPSMDRVCAVEPEMQEVLSAADSLGLDMPAADLRERMDEETARHIAEQVLPLSPAERRTALDGLLALVVAAALQACGDAVLASGRYAGALLNVERARREGGHWMDPMEERAEVLALEAGSRLVAAHQRCQEAHGVARAVMLARRGEAWMPCGAAETTAWLTESGMVRKA